MNTFDTKIYMTNKAVNQMKLDIYETENKNKNPVLLLGNSVLAKNRKIPRFADFVGAIRLNQIR